MFFSPLSKFFYLTLTIAMALCSCSSKPNNSEYTPPTKEQTECLKEYRALEKQESKDRNKIFFEVMKSQNDDELINYELASRRNKEKLCMIKADCYDQSKGIQFSDCVNDVIPEYEN
jgi:hypothetical protein